MTIPTGFALSTIVIAGPFTDGTAVTTIGTDIPGAFSLQDVADNVKAAFASTVWSDAGNNDCTFQKVESRSATNVATASANIVGTHTGALAMINTALLVKKLSGLIGRANRGRMYIPGVLDEAAVDNDGRLATGTIGAYQDSLDAFLGAIIVASLSPVILHSSAATPTVITNLVVESQCGTQRRRMRR